jgi:hypothetical protein
MEAEVIDTLSFGLFLVRVGKGSRATLELARVSEGVWVPDQLEVFASARLGLLQTLRIEQRIHYSRYSSVPEVAGIYPAEVRDAGGAGLNQFAKATSP